MKILADDPSSFDLAVVALKAGEPIVLPTDTVYGLACLAGDARARQAIFDLKERPPDKAMALLVASAEQAHSLIVADERSVALADAFWPGSLTIVAPPVPGGDPLLGGPDGAVGVRCPNHPWVRALAEEVGPIAATSANRHGEDPQFDPSALASAFSLQLVVDGGQGGEVASTVVRLWPDEAEVLREGGVTKAQIDAVLSGAAATAE